MKTALKFAPIVLAALAAAGPAMAHDNGRGRGHDRNDGRDYSRYDDGRRDHRRDDRRDGYWRDGRWYANDGRYDGRYEGRHDGRYDGRDRRYHPASGHWDNGRRGPPPWARGRDYRSYGYQRIYYVPYTDYRRYRLYAPRPGYRWVRDDRDNFLLVAAATGIITSILVNHGY